MSQPFSGEGGHLSQPFTGDGAELSDGEGEDAESIFSHMDMLSPSHHTDAQTLAIMLQEQLDAINNEIRSGFPLVVCCLSGNHTSPNDFSCYTDFYTVLHLSLCSHLFLLLFVCVYLPLSSYLWFDSLLPTYKWKGRRVKRLSLQ